LGKRAHFFSTCMLCLGAHLSAVWIIAANSFMQTPAGFELQFTDPITGAVQTLAQGAVPTAEQIPHTRAVISDFWKMALSASFADRFFHTVAGAWICGAFFALGVCGWLVLKGRTNFAEPCAKIALVFGAVSSAAMMFTGHESARTLACTQPEKIAAFEGHYNTVSSAPLCLVGNVDEQKREVSGIKADGLFSFLAFGSFDSEVKGLNDLPSDEFLRRIYPNATPAELERVRPKFWPPVNFSFHSFRIMAYLGGAIAAFAAWGFALWIFGILFDLRKPLSKWFWRASLLSILLPLAASQAGWALAEVGRQPWIVWHVLKTSDAVTTSASAGEILFSIILFSAIFAAVTAVALKILFSKIGAEG
ncbi:MAG: cytochrome ubiquinol oxidase subunit I, partial [Opitutales bacterium]|nr:cytochrome ubiquinol oxidase subunit I [Opitutales bacterium]